MSKSTSADSGEPEDHGRGEAAPGGAEDGDQPHTDDAAAGTPASEDAPEAEEAGAYRVRAEDAEPATSESDEAEAPSSAQDGGKDSTGTSAGGEEPAAAAKHSDRAGEKGGAGKDKKAAGRTRSTSVRSARGAGGSSSGRPTSVRAAESGKGRATVARADAEAARTTRPNAFARIIRYVREVIAELRKVVTPTRNELFTYATVVVVFLIIMMAYVGALDYGIGRLVLWAFGG